MGREGTGVLGRHCFQGAQGSGGQMEENLAVTGTGPL